MMPYMRRAASTYSLSVHCLVEKSVSACVADLKATCLNYVCHLKEKTIYNAFGIRSCCMHLVFRILMTVSDLLCWFARIYQM